MTTLIELAQPLLDAYNQHPVATLMAGGSTVAFVLKKLAPNWRVTKAINALATDAPEIVSIGISFATKKTLLKALELSGHVFDDVAKAVEDKPKQEVTTVVTQPAQAPTSTTLMISPPPAVIQIPTVFSSTPIKNTNVIVEGAPETPATSMLFAMPVGMTSDDVAKALEEWKKTHVA